MKSKKTIFASLIFLLSLFSFLNGVIFQHKKAYATNWNKLKIVNQRCFQNRVDGNYEKAIDYCTQAIEIYSQNSGAYFNRGFANEGLENYDAAIDDYLRSIELDTKISNQFAYNNLALVYAYQENYKEALKNIEIAIRIKPKDGLYIENRGWINMEAGNYKQAEKDYLNAKQLYLKYKKTRTYADCFRKGKNPNLEHCMLNTGFYNNLGWIQKNLKKYDLALDNYNKSIKINSPEEDLGYWIYSNRADVKYELGDKAGSCRDYKTASSMGDYDIQKWLGSWDGRWCRKM